MSNKLIIYNLETDSSSKVLASSVDWIREFSLHFDTVLVFSTHVGPHDLPANVSVCEVGGGNVLSKIRAVKTLYASLKAPIVDQGEFAVFHHMSSRTLAILGPFFRILRVRQVLWYSHNHASLDLKIGLPFVNVVVTPTRTSFPLQSGKLKITGHGVKTFVSEQGVESDRKGILSVGRLARVKRFELLADEMLIHELTEDYTATIVGPDSQVANYRIEIQKYFAEKGVSLDLLPALEHNQIQQLMFNFEYFYSGTPNSVDKAAIEAAYAGCFIVSPSQETIELTGMSRVWEFLSCEMPSNVGEQLALLGGISKDEKVTAREILIRAAKSHNNLEGTILQISSILKQDLLD